jgi:glycerol uptake facilitator-like aquaporin
MIVGREFSDGRQRPGIALLLLWFSLLTSLNPAVTLADASQGGLAWRDVLVYISAQITGAYQSCSTIS